MMNITNTMFKSEKKSTVKEHKKLSFLNTQSLEQPSETISRLCFLFIEDDSSNMVINPKVMEVWLNDILAEAQELGLKTAYLKADKTKPISQFGIDRQTLGKLGLNTEVTNRLYRGLFVYSVGFFELIKKCTNCSKERSIIVATIWRVFAILLEY
jgi:hypothetical protein